jgi:hypothetical protein
MTIANAAEMTNRHWVEGDGLPPGFYYPAAVRPHLHLTCNLRQGDPATGPWDVAYLAFTAADGVATVIYQRSNGTNNQAAIANLPAAGNRTAAEVQAEATFVYNKR